jgi:outer membrane protein assembly factor BamB
LVRGDSGGTGVAAGTLPAEPKVLWEYKTGDSKAGFEGTPIISDGKVLVGDFEGTVHAIDLQTGNSVWKAKGKAGFTIAGAVSNGMFVIGDFSSNIYCFRVADGEQLWTIESDMQVVNGGNIIGDDVLLSSDSGTLFALDLKTGKEKWSYATNDQLRSSASLWKKMALLGGCDSQLHKIDVEKGVASGDSFSLMSPTLSTPNIVGDIAIIPTQQGVVFAIRLDTGETMWSYTPDPSMNADIRGSAAVLATVNNGKLEGIVVVPTRNRRLLGIDAATGKLKWESVMRKRSESSPVICDGRAWLGSSDGMVYGVDLDGKETWSYQLSGQILASPAIANDRIVIATEKGSVVCFGK